jgi:hypothetical protein
MELFPLSNQSVGMAASHIHQAQKRFIPIDRASNQVSVTGLHCSDGVVEITDKKQG